MRFLFAVCSFALSLALSASASAEGPNPDAPSSSPDSRALVGGSVLFGVGYGAALYVGQKNGFREESAWLLAPVAGPWAALVARTSLSSWGMVADGITQAGGALILVGAFVYPRRVLGPARAGGVRLEAISIRPDELGACASF